MAALMAAASGDMRSDATAVPPCEPDERSPGAHPQASLRAAPAEASAATRLHAGQHIAEVLSLAPRQLGGVDHMMCVYACCYLKRPSSAHRTGKSM